MDLSRTSLTFPRQIGLLVCVLFGCSNDAVVGLCLPPSGRMSDSVTIWQNGSWNTLPGRVIKVQGTLLQFQSADEFSLKTLPLSEVKSFQFGAPATYYEGKRAFQAGEHERAERLLKSAVEKENRDWAKVEILGAQASNRIAMKQEEQSIELFRKIYEIDPNSRHLGRLPLTWELKPPPQRLWKLSQEEALKADEIVQSIVASQGILKPGRREASLLKLETLQKSSKSSVLSQLATAQQWRLALSDTNAKPLLTDSWKRQWEAMPAEVRIGPGYVLGRCLQKQNRDDDAALVFLWSPLVQPTNRILAALSLQRATESLRRAGRLQEAERVDRILRTQYADVLPADSF